MGWQTGRMRCLALPQPGWRGYTAGAHATVSLIDAHAAHSCSCGGLHETMARMVRNLSGSRQCPAGPPTFCSAPPNPASKLAAHCPRSPRCDMYSCLCCRPESQQEGQAAQRRDWGQWQAGTTGGKAQAAGPQCVAASLAHPLQMGGLETSRNIWPHIVSAGFAPMSHAIFTALPVRHMEGQGLPRLHALLWEGDEQAIRRCACWAFGLTRPAQHERLPSLPASNGSHSTAAGSIVVSSTAAACTPQHELELCGRPHLCQQAGMPLPAGCDWQVAPSPYKAWPLLLAARWAGC